VDVLNATRVDASKVDVVVAPPALHIGLVQPLLQRNIAVCAQNVSLTGTGAFTGEIAAEQLVGALCLLAVDAVRTRVVANPSLVCRFWY
jgi:triosephosphate isomerase